MRPLAGPGRTFATLKREQAIAPCNAEMLRRPPAIPERVLRLRKE
jgi:hypothetical protein